MTVTTRQVIVNFHLIEPFGHPAPFAIGHYPREAVFRHLSTLDPATDEYRIKHDLLGGETLCFVHEGDVGTVLGAYYKDLLTLPLTEYKGELSELMLREGEAVVDSSFVMFFPNDVVGILRSSNKAPGAARISEWLSIVGTVGCSLVPLRDPDATAQLDAATSGFRRLFLSIQKRRIDHIAEYSPRTAAALRAASGPISASDEVGIEIGVRDKEHQAGYNFELRERIDELFGVYPEFEKAQVKVKGARKAINLKRSYVAHSVPVQLVNTKKVGIAVAAEAISAAYNAEADHINKAAATQRGGASHGPSTS